MFLTINLLFSLAIYCDTYNRNQMAYKELTKNGYEIRRNKLFTNFIKDYLICFIPGFNLIKYFSNVSKSNGEYYNYRLREYKKRKMVKWISHIKITKNESNTSNISLDETSSKKEMIESFDEYYFQTLDKIDLNDSNNIKKLVKKR